MIKNVKITNHLGESIDMVLRSPEQSGFFIRRIDGLGPSKTNVNITQSLGVVGGHYNSSHTETRNIVFDLGFYNWTNESIETIRQKTYRYFPPRKPITIEVETDNRTGVITGYVETNEPNIFSKESSTIISVLCPSSSFFAKETINTIFSGVDGGFEFPFQNPSLTQSLIEFGNVFVDTSKSVVYMGDEETGVFVDITVLGSVNNLSIHDLTTGQSIIISSTILTSMTGANLQAGDRIFISTSAGSKYIYLLRNGVYINILNAISVINGWFTLVPGDNVFTYTASSGLSNLMFLIQHNLVYIGM